VIPVPWQGLGRPLPGAAAGAAGGHPDTAEGHAGLADEPNMTTDLSVLVNAIRGASASLGLPVQRSPWLARCQRWSRRTRCRPRRPAPW